MAALGATTVAAGVLAVGTMSADAATTRPSSNSTQSSPSIQQVTDQVTDSYTDNDTANGHTVSPDHPWTINYRDSTGHITRVWHGTRAAATALGQQWKSGRGGVAPAPSIIKTNSCREPTTYWVFFNSGMACYAYGGSLNLHITGVYEVDSGNNVGYYRIGSHDHSLARFTSDFWSTAQTVSFIHIK
jgi:hypothetical protein